jgi:hypothetical protein
MMMEIPREGPRVHSHSEFYNRIPSLPRTAEFTAATSNTRFRIHVIERGTYRESKKDMGVRYRSTAQASG